ncbi:3-hydroxyacyl-CoA dehydrogenase [Herbaspirillum huttiense]|uniref:3-hydroxyacyl-CoA dehydrogenase n=1 Tax=Herbaspirillum huttiense TaxID=863372 RepID=UPI0039B09F55
MSAAENTCALPATAAVAVIGSGTMGAGIAQVAAMAGHPVQLYDSRDGAAAKAIAEIRASLDRLANKGKITAGQAEGASERLAVAGSLQEMRSARLVVEAIIEQLAAKQELFGKLEAIVDAQCILASNTSSISITHIGATLRHPERLVGMHFFNPVPQMALVEIIRGLASDAAVARCVQDTARAWGKVPVLASSTPGFIVNRLARPYYAEALRVLNECGAQPATIDALLREAGGFRMGPFELMDLIGHDVNFAVTQSVFQAYFNDPRFTPSLIQQELVHAGYLGRKSGRGFYRYDDAAETPQPATEPVFDVPTVPLQLFGTHPLVEVVRARYKGRVEYCAPRADNLLLKGGPGRLYVTEGRTATQQSHDYNMPDVVLVDLALDYAKAPRLGLARADQCRDRAYQAVAGVLQSCGFALSPVQDVPGMAVMRTVCMLVNEAADAVNQGVCSRSDADMAMQKGVNYPRGPLAWADAIGLDTVANVLRQLSATYGEDRYRVSPLLQRLQASGRKFHE